MKKGWESGDSHEGVGCRSVAGHASKWKSTLHTAHNTQHTAQCTLHMLHTCIANGSRHCTMHNAHCTHHTSQHTAHNTLHNAHATYSKWKLTGHCAQTAHCVHHFWCIPGAPSCVWRAHGAVQCMHIMHFLQFVYLQCIMCSAKASLYIYVVFSIPLQGACHVNLYKRSVCNVGFSIKQCAPIAGGEVRKGWSCFPCIAFSSFHSHNCVKVKLYCDSDSDSDSHNCVKVKLCCDSNSDVTSSVSHALPSPLFTHTTVLQLNCIVILILILTHTTVLELNCVVILILMLHQVFPSHQLVNFSLTQHLLFLQRMCDVYHTIHLASPPMLQLLHLFSTFFIFSFLFIFPNTSQYNGRQQIIWNCYNINAEAWLACISSVIEIGIVNTKKYN